MSAVVTPDRASAPAVTSRRPGLLSRWWLWALVGLLALSLARVVTGADDVGSAGTLRAALISAVPIALAGLGGLWSERAGVVNIGLEGMMILGTWGAAWGSYHGGPWLGLLAACLFGALGGLLHAIATVTFGVNHIVSGVALNLLGLGIAKYLAHLVFQPLSGNPRQSPVVPKFDTYSVTGLTGWLADLEAQQRVVLSDVDGLLRRLLTQVAPLTMIAILLVPV